MSIAHELGRNHPHEAVCPRCLIPSTCWAHAGVLRCEPCHRTEHGDRAIDKEIVGDHARFGRLWSARLLDRVATR